MTVEAKQNGLVVGKVHLSVSRKKPPKGSFAGILHVKVHAIDGFCDNAGFLDKVCFVLVDSVRQSGSRYL